MTALAILARRDLTVIITDTLSVGRDEMPAAFNSKALILPHLHMVIAAQGIFGIAEALFDVLRSSEHKEFADANRAAPELLRDFWADCVKVHALGNEHSVEVYLAGVDPTTGACAVFLYRSRDGFEAERFPETCVYPGSVRTTVDRLTHESQLSTVGRPVPPAPEAVFTAIAEDQRLEYTAAGKPYAVGGRLNVTELSPRCISTRTVHVFEGFDDAAAQIAKRSNQAHTAPRGVRGGWLRRLLGGSR